MKEDFWSVPKEEWLTNSNILVDMIFKNREACSIHKIGDDMINHCLADEDACWSKVGHLKNALFNIVPIAGEYYNMFHEAKDQSLCVGDDEIIEGWASAYAEWIHVVTMVHDLHINWVSEEPIEHISIKDYKKEKKIYKKEKKADFISKVVPWVWEHVQALLKM